MQIVEPEPQQDQLKEEKRRKQLRLERRILVITVMLIIVAVVVGTIWIMVSQGINQNTPSILAVVVPLVIGLPALMYTYFQWRHPLSDNAPAPVTHHAQPIPPQSPPLQ